jgi:porin
VRLRIDPCQYGYFQFGAYDGNPDRTHGGTDFNMSEDQGALLYFEFTLKINQSKEAKGPPGNIKVGGYYHTGDFADYYQGAFNAFDTLATGSGLPPLSPGPASNHRGNYGFYLLADQMLWRETGKDDPANQGLAGFFRVATAPSDRNLAQFGIDGGLVYKGLIPSRDWDTFAIAYSYLEISDDLRNAQRDINTTVTGFSAPAPFTAIADYEAALEISYKMQLTAWMTVQASFQRVFHPGGRVLAEIPDASVFIVQTTLRF